MRTLSNRGIFGMRTARVETLQDGIFAVAMTLLATDLKISDNVPVGDLQSHIVAMVPKVLVYAATFAFVIAIWLYTYNYQELVVKHDTISSLLCLAAAGSVALLPFTSGTFASHLHGPSAAILLSINLGLTAFVYGLTVEYCNRTLIPGVVDKMLLRRVANICWAFAFADLALFPAAIVVWPFVTVAGIAIELVIAYAIIFRLHPEMVRAGETIRSAHLESV